MDFKDKSLTDLIESMIETNSHFRKLTEVIDQLKHGEFSKYCNPNFRTVSELADTKKKYEAIKEEIDRREKLYTQKAQQ